MRLGELTDRLDERLRIPAYAELDPSANGLQVGSVDHEIERVAVAVDAAQATIEAAAERGVDLLVVHHGIVWGGIERVTGRTHDRIAALIENDIALYVAHLPLDGHQSMGNAAGLADLLGLEDRTGFGTVGDEPIGVRGHLSDPELVDDIASLLAASLPTGGADVQVIDFGPEQLSSIAIVTGAGTEYLEAAASEDVDAFITGEGKGRTYHDARELGMTVFLAGHYATETTGVNAIADLLEEWDLETSYIEHPTGL